MKAIHNINNIHHVKARYVYLYTSSPFPLSVCFSYQRALCLHCSEISLHLWVSMSNCCIDLQVREQQRYIALQIRQAVEQKRQHELEQLERQLRQDWERQQREKLDTLQRLYQESIQLLGQGHRSAKENVRL